MEKVELCTTSRRERRGGDLCLHFVEMKVAASPPSLSCFEGPRGQRKEDFNILSDWGTCFPGDCDDLLAKKKVGGCGGGEGK